MSRGQFLVVHFLGFSGGLCIFRILMSYEVTRGVVLVVGRVTDEFFHSDPNEIISILHILNRLVETISER